MKTIEIISVNCCGEIGDVIIEGVNAPPGKTILEQSQYLKKDKKLWNFVINEPRGGVFKHINLLVPPINPKADIGFIIMEPLDTPPMSGSNAICVTTTVLEQNIIPIKNKIMNLTLEAPGGLIKVKAYCENKKVIKVELTNLPSFVIDLDKTIDVKGLGKINVSTAYGGDSFVLVENKYLNIEIKPENAKKIVDTCSKITEAANNQLDFQHPTLKNLDYISFCMLMDKININKKNIKHSKNSVCIRPKKLDRSPCGTGTSARLAYMYKKNMINLNEEFISESILGTKFSCFIKKEYKLNSVKSIIPTIIGNACITGTQKLYIDEKITFPEGYRLGDTWPQEF